MKSKPKILVIGAGISGLTAARILKQKGYNVQVLESSNYIGGRIKTRRESQVIFEEGASWIHGYIGNPIYQLSKKCNVKSVITKYDDIVAYNEVGRKISKKLFNKEEERYEEVLSSLENYGELNESFWSVYKNDYSGDIENLIQQFFRSAYLTFDTGGLNKLSSVYYNEGEEFKGGDRLIVNGYDRVVKFLAKGLDISFNQRVLNIDWEEEIKIETQDYEYKADKVIITVPLGVLKNNVINFTPQLPENKIRAIKGIGMNKVNKYLFQWNNVFWNKEQFMAYTARRKDLFNYFVNLNKIDINTKALMTFAYDNEAERTEKLSDKELVDELMIYLKTIYGNGILYPNKVLRSRWVNNENTYGAYSFTSKETIMSYFDDLASPVNNKLLFAGEHTCKKYFSTVHGAFLSGVRVAKRIIN